MRYVFLVAVLLARPAGAQESKLIATLKSDAPQMAKVDACRELARVGTKQAVPVLGALLADEKLSHMARYALEAIPDPSVDTALRGALSRVRGERLAGVIASLGVRRDPKAVAPLGRLLADADANVAQAAARALGAIGPASAPALLKALGAPRPELRPAVCEGLMRCAEAMPPTEAGRVYDRLRSLKDAPRQVHLAALSGAIRSRGSAGLPLVVQAIRSEPPDVAAAAMQLAAGIPGAVATKALCGELAGAPQPKRLLLLRALGARGDAAAAPAIERYARTGPAPQRVAAIGALLQLRSPASLAVLVAAAGDREAGVAAAARAGLVGFPGRAADAAVVGLLSSPDPAVRAAMADVATQRRVKAAVPALLKAAREPDAGISGAAYRALGVLAGSANVAAMADALLGAKNVGAAEEAISAVCARQQNPAACAEPLVAALGRAQGEPRLALLRLMGVAGGPRALAAVRAALADTDAAVKQAAVQVLCDWPSPDALNDLASLAAASKDRATSILALRGQFRLIPLENVPAEQKVDQVRALLPRADRHEEQTLALAVLGQLPTAGALEAVVPYLTGGVTDEEAAVAAVAIGGKLVATHPADVAEALGLVRTANAELAGRVRQVLANVPEGAVEPGFTRIFNGKDLTGWEGKPGWWAVEDGAVTSESTPEKPCSEANYLRWRGGQPADFELLASFKLSAAANSGIQIRSEERPNWDTFGYQADMTGDGSLVGFVYHHSRGLIAGRGERAVFDAAGTKTVQSIGDPAELLKHFRQNDWNTYRVVCRGPEIALYVNGVLMCHIADHHATLAAKRGIIALQMHPGPPMKVQFRNVRIKELK